MRDLRQVLQQEDVATDTREDTHEGETVQLCTLRQEVFTEEYFDRSHPLPHRRETVRVLDLSEGFCHQDFAKSARENSRDSSDEHLNEIKESNKFFLQLHSFDFLVVVTSFCVQSNTNEVFGFNRPSRFCRQIVKVVLSERMKLARTSGPINAILFYGFCSE